MKFIQPSYARAIKLLQSFTLFEVLIAWSIFISAFLMLSTAQLNCLKRIRFIYLHHLVALQLVNVSQEVEASDPINRASVINDWHRLNQSLFPMEQDRWSCIEQYCCFELTWQYDKQWARYCHDV